MPCTRLAAVLLTAGVALAGCGSDNGGGQAATTVTGAQNAPSDSTPAVPPGLELPAGIPTTGSGPAPAATARVVRAWLRALRGGHIAKAATYFAEPSKVQNGTPVLTLRTRAGRLAFNAAFPCGATATRLQSAARGFTVVTFKLTERRGGDCHGASGAPAHGAIRVRNGRITDWYRLPEARSAPAPAPNPALTPDDTAI